MTSTSSIRTGTGKSSSSAIRQCILRVDTEKNEMHIHLMEGLLP